MCPFVGDESLTVAIDYEVKFFKHSNSNQDMRANNHSFLACLASHHLDSHDFRHINFLNLIVDISRRGTAKPQKP